MGGDERRLRERIQSANANASVCSGPPRRVAHARVTAPVLHEGRPERLLVITAHPDDADFGVAGSVARWVGEGTVARLVCCTSGDAGSDDARTDPLELATLREREQRDAAAIVGYESVTYLHQPDGALANDLALREQLVRILRTFRPDTVAAPDPTVVIHDDGFIQHVDHRAAAMAAVDAVYPASENAMAFPHLVTAEGLEPHVVSRLVPVLVRPVHGDRGHLGHDRHEGRGAPSAREPAAQARRAGGLHPRAVGRDRQGRRRRGRRGVPDHRTRALAGHPAWHRATAGSAGRPAGSVARSPSRPRAGRADRLGGRASARPGRGRDRAPHR